MKLNTSVLILTTLILAACGKEYKPFESLGSYNTKVSGFHSSLNDSWENGRSIELMTKTYNYVNTNSILNALIVSTDEEIKKSNKVLLTNEGGNFDYEFNNDKILDKFIEVKKSIDKGARFTFLVNTKDNYFWEGLSRNDQEIIAFIYGQDFYYYDRKSGIVEKGSFIPKSLIEDVQVSNNDKDGLEVTYKLRIGTARNTYVKTSEGFDFHLHERLPKLFEIVGSVDVKAKEAYLLIVKEKIVGIGYNMYMSKGIIVE